MLGEDKGIFGEYARRTSGGPPRPLLLEVLRLMQENGAARPKTALDLGCGAGNDTLHLLEQGWTVTALDASREALDLLRERAGERARQLTLLHGLFHQLPRRKYGLVYASLSLPFCPPQHWERSWQAIRRSVAVRGWFAATLFGLRDEWANRPEMTFTTPDEVSALLSGFQIEKLQEWRGEARLASGNAHQAHLITVMARG